MKRLIAIAAAGLWAGAAVAGEYHSGGTLFCADCHTMHSSMQHGFDGGTVGAKPTQGGNWLAATTPQQFLLKDTANQLCLNCHDGQTFAPDVLGANANASPTQGRSAGALNTTSLGAPYESFKGHTLGSTATPPGFDPTVIGAAATWYDPTRGLECINCHAQHGPATSYRNLGSYSLGAAAAAARPSYVIAATNDTTKDVWVNLASYASGSGAAATFNPYYDNATISYNRNDATVGTTKTSNKIDTLCAACHGAFHGGQGNTNIGGDTNNDGFIRHPTSGVTIGASTAGGHSSLARYTDAAHVNKVKVYANDRTGFTDASPGCVSCHKAHGNQNPFSLIFMNRSTGTIDEEGTGAGQNPMQGQRNLCGQCHGQGA